MDPIKSWAYALSTSSSTDSANLDLMFVIESRSGSKEFSDLKIELSNSKHATVISSGGSEDRSLAAKGQRVVLSCKVQVSRIRNLIPRWWESTVND